MRNIEHLPAIDINELLIKDSPATVMVRVSGSSMEGVGICAGDYLVVDKGLAPTHGNIVIKDGDIALIAENPDYPPIEFKLAKSWKYGAS
ncbi:LexA family protein [Gulbenkiania mobilis]|uniref:LexA family protein n=1 Tax=Gulbenkiania mobilis TaxID=397457 RepID=UPI0006BBFA80|nr:S24 family peptidase [Gulbenkiania mobilis]